MEYLIKHSELHGSGPFIFTVVLKLIQDPHSSDFLNISAGPARFCAPLPSWCGAANSPVSETGEWVELKKVAQMVEKCNL